MFNVESRLEGFSKEGKQSCVVSLFTLGDTNPSQPVLALF